MLNHLFEVFGGNNTGLPPFHFAVFKYHERGHTLNTISTCCGRVAVHIDLEHGGLLAYTALEVLQDGAHHAAGAAPFGGEVDQHRLVAGDDVLEARGFL